MLFTLLNKFMTDVTFIIVESMGPRSITEPRHMAINKIKQLAKEHNLYVHVDAQRVDADSLTDEDLKDANEIMLLHQPIGG